MAKNIEISTKLIMTSRNMRKFRSDQEIVIEPWRATAFPLLACVTTLGIWVGGLAHIPLVTTLHGTDITLVGQDPSFNAITKFSIERSDRLTAVSEYLRRETYNAFGCTACDVRVIHNFVDPDEYNRERYSPGGRHRHP